MINFNDRKALNILANSALNDYKAFAHQTLTVSGVTSLTVPNDTKYALITIEAGDIRFWLDGSAPSTSDGLLRGDGSGIDIRDYSNIIHFRAINVTGTPVLQIQYWK